MEPHRIVFLESYYGGSHRQMIDLLHTEFGGDLYTLPPSKWNWRMRLSALHFSQVIPADKEYNVLFASSVLNLCELIALRPDLATLFKVYYFHENQLVYPVRKQQDRDFQHGYIQILSCLVADKVVFNSYYNMNSFLTSIQQFMSVVPDYRPKQLREKIEYKCSVLYFPVQMLQTSYSAEKVTEAEASNDLQNPLQKNDTAENASAIERTVCSVNTNSDSTVGNFHVLSTKETGCDNLTESICTIETSDVSTDIEEQPSQNEQILHIIWPHRWEHDKGPEEFCSVLLKLLDANLPFHVSILGSHSNDIPECLKKTILVLGSRILHMSPLSRLEYLEVLSTADVVISTAKHEFFGVAMLEAVFCGCYPLCPNRLVYPEIYPSECLYNTEQQLFKRLKYFCQHPTLAKSASIKSQICKERYTWTCLRDGYKELLKFGKSSLSETFSIYGSFVNTCKYSQGMAQIYPTNLFIGTGGEGFGIGSTPPGAQYPFGLVRLSPDTSTLDNVALDDYHFGGYYYYDDQIRCFSHTHMMGAGVVDYGNIGVMATSKLDANTVKNNGYRSKFSHKNETALPGYYAVFLETPNVFAELTVAGVYTGVHRYTYYNHGEKKYLILDVTHSVHEKAVVNSSFTLDSDSSNFTATGWALMKGSLTGRNGVGVKFYFSMKVIGAVVDYGVWEDSVLYSRRKYAGGPNCGAYAELSPTSNSVVVVLSLSLISIAQANHNMEHDWNDSDFQTTAYSAQKVWSKALLQIEIDTMDSDTTQKFYTALYHVMAAPTQFSESGGVYMGVDNKVHVVPSGKRYFSDLSLWDIHRTQAPLLTLLQPDISGEITFSLLSMYEQGGALPRWPIANVYGSSMIGNHGYQLILGNILKNPQLKVNLTEVYVAMKAEANLTDLPHDTRPCLKNYTLLGYCPEESEKNSASLTLAYSFDDWVVGIVATMLNFTKDAAYFLNRSENYRNIWDSKKKLMCPRSISGVLKCPVDPLLQTWLFEGSGYTEGNAEQWRWFVPHNIPGLIELFGSNETFVDQLDIFFERAKGKSNFLPNEYYWAGNEPDLLAVYLFNYAGRLDLTQKHARWLMENKYTSKNDGLPGNDDYGTLSAWYVWSALGLYPLSGTDKYFLGSPAVEKAVLHLPNGSDLYIIAKNYTAENDYANKIELNGRTVDKSYPFLQHTDISKGGTLTFWMSSLYTK